ncbi:GNAT family N-acetyltransferase [Microbacterium sp. gxy059]|uniref:GNAT family N-acetyltransferase n=1 Tax=Microbacterium sp. gxy059 TaxID=2957199 RepID=UPI003D99FC86
MQIDVVPVDPFDASAVAAWWQASADAMRADMGEHAVPWSLEESRAELQQRTSTVERRAYLAVTGGEIVGSGSLALPLKDNTRSASLAVSVPFAHRRRGVGTALLAHIEAAARGAARSVLHAETRWPAEAPADGSGQPGREFARRHGYDVALGDLQSTLALPVDPAHLAALRAEAESASRGYAIRGWVGPVPDDVVAGWAMLDSVLETEAPTGDLDIEASTADVAEVRESEELIARQGRTSFGAVALDADGQVVAYSQLVVSGDDGDAYQWGTLVRRQDRGHRLGLRVKTETLRILQRRSPETPRILTFNAEENGPMLAVNRRLGFAATGRLAELQKRVGAPQ